MKPKSKKLTPRQRRKEMTGINLERINRKFESLESKMQYLFLRYDDLLYHVKILAAGIVERNVEAKKKAGKR